MSAMAPASNRLPRQGDLIAHKYRIEKMLGAGGMGAVYLAHHEILRDRVAIKVLLPEVVNDRDALTRFINEARNARKIRNEHVAAIEDVDTLPNGTPFIVMEYLEGHDLGQCQKAWGAIAIAPAVDYVLQTLEALAEAHSVGIVHRDLKPANLFLVQRPDGSACIKVLDFGVSKSTDLNAPLQDGGGVTTTKAVLGSPGYMAPEQIRNARRVDARADIWSMGVILYKLLTNHKPFNGDTMGEVFAAIFEETPRPVRAYRPEVPEALEQIVTGRCLQRDRDRRFANVAEMAIALGPFGLPSSQASIEHIVRRIAASDGRSVSAPTGSFPAGMGGGDPLSHSRSVAQGSQASASVSRNASISQSHASQASQSQPSQASQSQPSQASRSQPSQASQSNGNASYSHASQSRSLPSQGSSAQAGNTGARQKSGRGALIAVVALLGFAVVGGGAFALKTVLGKRAAHATTAATGVLSGPDQAPSVLPGPDQTLPTVPTGRTSEGTEPTSPTNAATAPLDSVISVDSLPTEPTAHHRPTVHAPADPPKPVVSAKPKPSASAAPPVDDVLRSRR